MVMSPTLEKSVTGKVKYCGPAVARPRYHANDQSRDELDLDERAVTILNGRALAEAPSLSREGFALVDAPTRVADFRLTDQAELYMAEVRELVGRETGSVLAMNCGGGVLRFAEGSAESGRLNNSRPARFIHNDVSEPTARSIAERALAPRGEDLSHYRTFALYNIWRPFTPPPQNVPLAMLDGRTVSPADLVAADAVFDEPGKADWSFEGFLIRPNPAHRWIYFPDMTGRDALLFTTFAYRDGAPFIVPHTGFDDPTVGASVPRASIEMRVAAFFD